MNRSTFRNRMGVAGAVAVLCLFAPSLFPGQVLKYSKAEPGNGHIIRTVPFEKWLERNYCGPACLAMVLNSWDATRTLSQQAIADAIYDAGSQATYNSELVLFPRTRGFESYSGQGNLPLLKELVRNDIPVIVLTKTIKQIAKGHYRVVIGFDDDEGLIIFHDPYFGGRRAMKVKDFLKVWELGKGRNRSRWMMAAVPGGSALPLQGLRDDPLTSINLATAYYRRSDLAMSRDYWERARAFLGDDPLPLYSLAMVSLKEENVDEAIAYAHQALGLDAGNAYALDVLGLAYARQGLIAQSLQTLGRAARRAPDEAFIREHYLRAREIYIERARLEEVRRKERSDEKND